MIEVLKSGVLTTLQDLGRHNFRHLGVSLAGALDPMALTVANRLVGNPANSAGIEITLGPVELRFARAGWIALAGADFESTLDGTPVWPGWRIPVQAGQCLRLNAARFGMRAYLAIDGGIDVEPVMGSRSTDLNGGFGGWQGRALKAGDRLPIGLPNTLTGRKGIKLPDWTSHIRAIPGPEYDQFSIDVQRRFWSTEWKVTPQSNRMGYRLQGEPPLLRIEQRDQLSHGVLPGVIQVPPNGQPIVLLADAQTTGGYPRIAVVIEADLWKLAQAQLGAILHFHICDQNQAEAARQEHIQYLNRLGWS